MAIVEAEASGRTAKSARAWHPEEPKRPTGEGHLPGHGHLDGFGASDRKKTPRQRHPAEQPNPAGQGIQMGKSIRQGSSGASGRFWEGRRRTVGPRFGAPIGNI